MITLKQTLITMAAAGVIACANPLSAGSTATVIVGAPEATVTGLSRPNVPDGATDITNTTLSLELIQFTRARSEVNPLTKGSGSCNQGQRPDHNAAFDLCEQNIVAAVGGNPLRQWFYWGRWNDCDQCGQITTSKDGYFDFTSCGRKQTICVDTKNTRAHRIWHDLDHKTCYNIDVDFQLGCGSILQSNIWYPAGETACDW